MNAILHEKLHIKTCAEKVKVKIINFGNKNKSMAKKEKRRTTVLECSIYQWKVHSCKAESFLLSLDLFLNRLSSFIHKNSLCLVCFDTSFGIFRLFFSKIKSWFRVVSTITIHRSLSVFKIEIEIYCRRFHNRMLKVLKRIDNIKFEKKIVVFLFLWCSNNSDLENVFLWTKIW